MQLRPGSNKQQKQTAPSLEISQFIQDEDFVSPY
jgi:hypothetical protein